MLFAVSLLVRLAVWAVVKETPVFGDEVPYFRKIVYCEQALRAIFSGVWPSGAILDQIYDYGIWPPLHAYILAVGKILFGGLGGARLMLVLVSAATTPLLFKLARRYGFAPPTACAAALLHACYPEIIGFSHIICSETTFTFFVLAGLIFIRMEPCAQPHAGGVVLAGLLLGCAGLCRATVFPVLLLLAVWWAAQAAAQIIRGKSLRPARRPALNIVLLFAAFFMVTLPWLITLRSREGEWKPFSTAGGHNLYLGNHPSIPAGLGSAWGMYAYTGGAAAQIRNEINRHFRPAEKRYVTWYFAQDRICREAAWRVIRADPAAAIRRVFLRVGTLFAPDVYVPRYILNLIYRPMPVWLATLVMLANLVVWLLVLAGVSFGVWRRKASPSRWLLLSLAAALVVPALVTISVSRMRFTSTVLLLPLACEGLAALGRRDKSVLPPACRWGACGTLLISLWLCLLFCKRTAPHFFVPSAQYTPLVRVLSRLGFMLPETYDTFRLRNTGKRPRDVLVSLANWPQTRFVTDPAARAKVYRLSPSVEAPKIPVATVLGEPARLEFSVLPAAGVFPFEISAANLSTAWRATGLEGVEVKVHGLNFWKARQAP